MTIGIITKNEKDFLIMNLLHPSHRVKETVRKWNIMPWVTVKGINIKIVCHTTNTIHIRLMDRTLQHTMPEGAESFPNIKSHTLGTRCGVPQPLLGATKARDTEFWEMAIIRDFRFSANQDIIIRSSRSNSSKMAWRPRILETPIRTWTWIWLAIATNNQPQTQSIGNIK